MGAFLSKLLKSRWEAFYHVFPSLSRILNWKMFPLVLGEILGCLLPHWLPMACILLKIVRTWNSQFKCNYLKNGKVFLNLLFHFRILYQILNILKKRMIAKANAFPKLKNVKSFVRPLSKKRCFRTRFDTHYLRALQILGNLHGSLSIKFFHHSQGSWFGKCLP